MKLEIITPDSVIFSGEVTLVTVPGTKGLFTILENHAPIITSLQRGRLRYEANGKETEMVISGGFLEMNNNNINICVESIEK